MYAVTFFLGMLRHGCIQVLLKAFRCVVISNSDVDRESVNQMIENITTKWGNGKVILITNSNPQGNRFKSNKNVLVILNEVKNKYISPIFEIIPIQILFYSIAEQKMIEPGTFINSQKITKDF